MSTPTMDILTAAEAAQFAADVAASVADTQMTTDITFIDRGTATVDTSTGAMSWSETTASISAIQVPVTVDQGLGVEVGDVIFLVTVAGLSGKEPVTMADVLRNAAGHLFQIVAADRDPTGTLYRLHCRREKGLA